MLDMASFKLSIGGMLVYNHINLPSCGIEITKVCRWNSIKVHDLVKDSNVIQIELWHMKTYVAYLLLLRKVFCYKVGHWTTSDVSKDDN